MAVATPKGGLKNRNLAIGETFYQRVYNVCSGSVCNTGDTYRGQMISEAEELVEVYASAGTIVGGTTVNADLRKNGASLLTAPISFVGKQGIVVQGTIGAVTRFSIGDIWSVVFTNTGAGSFGQVVVTFKTRPLVGAETRL